MATTASGDRSAVVYGSLLVLNDNKYCGDDMFTCIYDVGCLAVALDTCTALLLEFKGTNYSSLKVTAGFAPATAVEAVLFDDDYCGKELARTVFHDELDSLNGEITSYRQLNNQSYAAYTWGYACRSRKSDRLSI